jgi:hypothetical protein
MIEMACGSPDLVTAQLPSTGCCEALVRQPGNSPEQDQKSTGQPNQIDNKVTW